MACAEYGRSLIANLTLPLALHRLKRAKAYGASPEGSCLGRVKLKAKFCPELLELDMTQVFGEHICRVVCTINEEDFDSSIFNDLAYVVIADLDVLHLRRHDRIL